MRRQKNLPPPAMPICGLRGGAPGEKHPAATPPIGAAAPLLHAAIHKPARNEGSLQMAAGSHISGTAGTPLSRMARQLSSRHAESRPAVCAAHSGHKTLSYPAADKNAHTSSQSACSQAHTVTLPIHARKSGGYTPGGIRLHQIKRKRIARPIRLQKGGEPTPQGATLRKRKGSAEPPADQSSESLAKLCASARTRSAVSR